jgi:hypothetical protein
MVMENENSKPNGMSLLITAIPSLLLRYSAYQLGMRCLIWPWCLRDNAIRSNPKVFATARYGDGAPDLRDSIASIAASIGSMMVELLVVEVEMLHMQILRGGSPAVLAHLVSVHCIWRSLHGVISDKVHVPDSAWPATQYPDRRSYLLNSEIQGLTAPILVELAYRE